MRSPILVKWIKGDVLVSDWISKDDLVNMGYTGPCFTWTRGKDMTLRGLGLIRRYAVLTGDSGLSKL